MGYEKCGLTRQRDSARVFVARETARNACEFAWQMARGEIKAASIAWATRDELTAAQLREKPAEREPREHVGAGAIPAPEDSLRAKVHEALQRREWAEAYWRDVAAAARSPAPDPPAAKVRSASEMREQRSEAFWRGVIAAAPSPPQDSLAAKVHAASEARQRRVELPAPEWLIPPYAGRDPRDSLGRGLDPAGIAAAVATDARVQQARSGPWPHLERAYRIRTPPKRG